jgi:hypothetical protein
MVIGIVVLAVLAAILLILFLTRDDDGTAGSSGSPTPSASGSASAAASGSVGASPSASTGASPSAGAPAPPDLAMDAVVATTVADLTVRESPGLDGERLGTLADGALSFVAGGPTDADGFRWYLLSGLGIPAASGCTPPYDTEPFNCPTWFGWAAAASQSGEPWLVEHDLACPQEPLTAESLAVGRTALERLACLGSEPFTFRGWWPEIPDDAGLGGACTYEGDDLGWLMCQDINYNTIVVDETEDFFGIGIRVSIDPATDASLPERGTWVEVRVHLDDPAAQGCDEAVVDSDERPPEKVVLDCRVEAVLETAQAVDGP